LPLPRYQTRESLTTAPQSAPGKPKLPASIPLPEMTANRKSKEQTPAETNPVVHLYLEQLSQQTETLKTTGSLLEANITKNEKQITGLLETSRQNENRLKNFNQLIQQQGNLVKNLEAQLAKLPSLIAQNEKIITQVEQLGQQLKVFEQETKKPSEEPKTLPGPKLNTGMEKRGVFKKWRK